MSRLDPKAVVHGDRYLLGQLLANLIENAIRHTSAGTQITVEVSRIGTRICLKVADTGLGIPV